MNISLKLADALIGALATGAVASIIVMIRTMFAIRRDVISYGRTISGLTLGIRHISTATRNQNAALRELGANGSTEAADACLDRADKAFDELLGQAVSGETR